MTPVDLLPFALLALSLVGAPLLLFLAFRALKRQDESRRSGF